MCAAQWQIFLQGLRKRRKMCPLFQHSDHFKWVLDLLCVFWAIVLLEQTCQPFLLIFTSSVCSLHSVTLLIPHKMSSMTLNCLLHGYFKTPEAHSISVITSLVHFIYWYADNVVLPTTVYGHMPMLLAKVHVMLPIYSLFTVMQLFFSGLILQIGQEKTNMTISLQA